MRDIPRAVGDQLAQDGFIAIVPDFLSGKGPNGGGTESLGAGVGQAIRTLTPTTSTRGWTRRWSTAGSCRRRTARPGVVGFCWGGARSFGYAAAQPRLNAAVVFYGDAPGHGRRRTVATRTRQRQGAGARPLRRQRRPHQRATVPATEAAMKKLGKSYESTPSRARATASWATRPAPAARTSRRRTPRGRWWLSSLEST